MIKSKCSLNPFLHLVHVRDFFFYFHMLYTYLKCVQISEICSPICAFCPFSCWLIHRGFNHTDGQIANKYRYSFVYHAISPTALYREVLMDTIFTNHQGLYRSNLLVDSWYFANFEL